MFSFAGRLLENDSLFEYLDVTTNSILTFYLPRAHEDNLFQLADILQQQQSTAMFSR